MHWAQFFKFSLFSLFSWYVYIVRHLFTWWDTLCVGLLYWISSCSSTDSIRELSNSLLYANVTCKLFPVTKYFPLLECILATHYCKHLEYSWILAPKSLKEQPTVLYSQKNTINEQRRKMWRTLNIFLNVSHNLVFNFMWLPYQSFRLLFFRVLKIFFV